MNPKIWGPHLWFILHIITFKYPKKPSNYDKDYHRDFFNNLKNILPCDDCKKHYSKNIQEYPITPHLDSREKLIDWLIHIHNQVNVSLNKPLLTRKEILDIYSNMNPVSPFKIKKEEKTINIINESQKKEKKNNSINIISFFIIVSVIIICILKWHKYKYYFNY